MIGEIYNPRWGDKQLIPPALRDRVGGEIYPGQAYYDTDNGIYTEEDLMLLAQVRDDDDLLEALQVLGLVEELREKIQGMSWGDFINLANTRRQIA